MLAFALVVLQRLARRPPQDGRPGTAAAQVESSEDHSASPTSAFAKNGSSLNSTPARVAWMHVTANVGIEPPRSGRLK
jgi:hypothetical protein